MTRALNTVVLLALVLFVHVAILRDLFDRYPVTVTVVALLSLLAPVVAAASPRMRRRMADATLRSVGAVFRWIGRCIAAGARRFL